MDGTIVSKANKPLPFERSLFYVGCSKLIPESIWANIHCVPAFFCSCFTHITLHSTPANLRLGRHAIRCVNSHLIVGPIVGSKIQWYQVLTACTVQNVVCVFAFYQIRSAPTIVCFVCRTDYWVTFPKGPQKGVVCEGIKVTKYGPKKFRFLFFLCSRKDVNIDMQLKLFYTWKVKSKVTRNL